MYIFFLLILIIILLFIFLNNKKKALLFSFLLITIVAALRKYTVGVDTNDFCNAFTNIGLTNSWNYSDFRYEPGFYYLCKILYIIFKDPQSLIVTSSIFVNFSVYRFVKNNSKNYFISTILYIIMNIFFSYLNVMRQAIAIAVLLFGYDYIKNKKIIKYLIVVSIAYLFHKVAVGSIFLVLFMVLPKKKSSYFVILVTAIATFVLYKPFFNFISSGLGYSEYANGSFGIGNTFAAVFKFFETLVVILLLTFFAHTFKSEKKNNDIHVLYITALIYLWFQLLSIKMIIFNRIYGLYGIYLIVLISNLLTIIREKNSNNYKFLKGFVIGLYFLSFIIISYSRPEWYGVIPYSFFWE